jgi:hypothetical protein
MFFKKIILIFVSILLSVLFCEVVLRVKHYFVLDYDIEMWRYANILKTKSDDPKINHVHLKNKTTNLQGVEIKTNRYGQRDIDYNNNDLSSYDRSFLFIGSSITLGWGVESKDTFVNLLNQKAKNENKNWLFVNGGVGNYNTERYVNNYLKSWKDLEFTDIIINFFVNDTELIKKKETNFFLKNTHLGVVTWKILNNLKSYQKNESLIDYYKLKYREDYPGYIIAKKEMLNLKKHCQKKNLNCSIILLPDIHKTNPYPLTFIKEKISLFAKQNKISFFDLYEGISSIENKKLWNKYNDPHPNELGHSLFANSIYINLNK